MFDIIFYCIISYIHKKIILFSFKYFYIPIYNMNSFDPNKIPDGTDPNNPVVILTDGVFDCFHYGHALLLKQVKEMFPHVKLIVGIVSDEDVKSQKGKCILTDKERFESIKHCRYTDQVLADTPWTPSVEYLNSIGAHYIAHDPEPYPYGDMADVYGEIKVAGRFLPTKRTDGISTSDIMLRIIRNYDEYVERSIKKGATWEELNIKENKYFALKVKLFTEKVERHASPSLSRCFKKWLQKSKNK